MSSLTDAIGDEGTASARAPAHAVRPFYWSVRRELWETRSILIAPLIGAGVVLLGFLVALRGVSAVFQGDAHILVNGHAAHLPPEAFFVPSAILAALVIVIGVVVGIFFSLGALYNERRDRSLLFWKSLPISNLVAVGAKAFVPLLVVPAVSVAVAFAGQVVMVLLETIAVLLHHGPVSMVWDNAPIIRDFPVLLFGAFAVALWYAPIYAWMLLASAWAKRAPVLWAFGIPLGLCVFEGVAFGTSNFWDLLKSRLFGGPGDAFHGPHHGAVAIDVTQIDFVGFVSDPGLWIGFAFAAACLAGAVYLRRRREPV
jgi:ABC-2 type transport system permease protein